MEKKNNCVKVGFSRILVCVSVILLCAVPCGARTVYSGDTLNVGTGYPDEQILNDWLDVYGTLNMYSGAYVDWGIYAYSGSTVNIYAGEIGAGSFIQVNPVANITVYGTAFSVDGVPLDPSVTEFMPVTDIGSVLTVTYENEILPTDLLFYSDIPINLQPPPSVGPEEITIDIKPGSYPNSINLGSHGVIPVAILSEEGFDATTVLPETVSLAGAGVRVRGKGNKYLASQEDVNGDGLIDLVVKVETENLDPDTFQDGYAILTGQTDEGVEFEGSDEIRIVPPE